MAKTRQSKASWFGGGVLAIVAGLVWVFFTENSPAVGWMFVAIGAMFIAIGAASERGR